MAPTEWDLFNASFRPASSRDPAGEAAANIGGAGEAAGPGIFYSWRQILPRNGRRRAALRLLLVLRLIRVLCGPSVCSLSPFRNLIPSLLSFSNP